MAVERLEHIGINVDDLDHAIAFFTELGLEVEGEASVEGELVDRIIGLTGAKSRLVIMRTPDGDGKIELVEFESPRYAGGDNSADASNVPGIRHILFRVDDLEDTFARLQKHGAELVGSIENYHDMYKLCYIRGPQGIIIELAEQLGERDYTEKLDVGRHVTENPKCHENENSTSST